MTILKYVLLVVCYNQLQKKCKPGSKAAAEEHEAVIFRGTTGMED